MGRLVFLGSDGVYEEYTECCEAPGVKEVVGAGGVWSDSCDRGEGGWGANGGVWWCPRWLRGIVAISLFNRFKGRQQGACWRRARWVWCGRGECVDERGWP